MGSTFGVLVLTIGEKNDKIKDEAEFIPFFEKREGLS